MLFKRHPNRPRRLYHPALLMCALGVLCGSLLFADDDLDDVLKSAKPAATAPVEPDSPQSQPTTGLSDALGTMKPKAPVGARIGTVTLQNGAKIEGRIWTPLQTPLRVWIEETKSYRDLDLSLVTRIDVHVLSEGMEDDWRWLKEGSDQKIFSGKKYPNVELAYKFTLLNGQIVEGPIVAEIDTFDGTKKRTLALYKKYHGKLDETLKDLVYIKSIVLASPESSSTRSTPSTSHLPLIY